MGRSVTTLSGPIWQVMKKNKGKEFIHIIRELLEVLGENKDTITEVGIINRENSKSIRTFLKQYRELNIDSRKELLKVLQESDPGEEMNEQGVIILYKYIETLKGAISNFNEERPKIIRKEERERRKEEIDVARKIPPKQISKLPIAIGKSTNTIDKSALRAQRFLKNLASMEFSKNQIYGSEYRVFSFGEEGFAINLKATDISESEIQRPLEDTYFRTNSTMSKWQELSLKNALKPICQGMNKKFIGISISTSPKISQEYFLEIIKKLCTIAGVTYKENKPNT